MSRRVYLPGMILALIGLFLGVNLFIGAALPGARLDLTEDGLYQISPGSRTVMERLSEPVEWRFYYSRGAGAQYPAVRAYADRVREMLRGFADQSGGRVRLTEIDPAPFSADEDDALAAGLTPIQGEGGEAIYFGLIARNSVAEESVIALFSDAEEARLEYDLARLIAELDRDSAPRLAVLTGLPLSPDDGAAPNRLFQELGADFDLVWIDRDFERLPEAEALLILHPPSLSQTQLYAIDQFALRRGRVIAMLDPMAHMALRAGPDGLPPIDARRGSDLGPLPAAWGAAYDVNTASMDRTLGLPVQVREGGRTRVRAYPLWFASGPAELNREDIAVATLDRGVNFGSPGALAPIAGSGLDFTPLVTTSADGALTSADIAAGAPSPDDLIRDYTPEPAPIVLGARLHGFAETAFPEGPPPGEVFFDPDDHVERSSGPVDLVLIADVDWVDDGYYIRQDEFGASLVADNLALALNLIDMAIGDPALIGLRSRAPSARPMTRVDELRAAAETRYLTVQDELRAALEEAETRLAGLQETGSDSVLSGADTEARLEARALRGEIAEIRAQLRQVERDFRTEIDALDSGLQFWTIGAPTAFIILLGLAGALKPRRRRKAGAPS